MNDLQNNLSKLISNFNDRRVLTEAEMKQLMASFVQILQANKQAVEALNSETKRQLQGFTNDHANVLKAIKADLSLTKDQVAQSTKEQNDRAFQRLQMIINGIKLPKDGKDGQPGQNPNPQEVADLVLSQLPKDDDKPEELRDKLELLTGEDRLDVSAIKGLEKYFGKVYKKGKDMLVGGFRFLEQLYDVAVIVANHRQDLLLQYNNTNKRWQDGIALTVGITAPSNPQIGDLWVDTN